MFPVFPTIKTFTVCSVYLQSVSFTKVLAKMWSRSPGAMLWLQLLRVGQMHRPNFTVHRIHDQSSTFTFYVNMHILEVITSVLSLSFQVLLPTINMIRLRADMITCLMDAYNLKAIILVVNQISVVVHHINVHSFADITENMTLMERVTLEESSQQL